MKLIHWIILGLVVVMTTWFIYQTRNRSPRVDIPIDLNWRFVLGDPEDAENPRFDDSGWRYVSLPHDWMIEQPVDENYPSGKAGGFYEGGVGWYRKVIDLREYQYNDQFYLLFEGVQRNADVYFNGTYLGRQVYGYSSFYHDISSLVRFDTVNVIAVRTDCTNLPLDRWYSGGGIYRHVRLISTGALHVPVWGSAVTSSVDSLGHADLHVSFAVRNPSPRSRRFVVHYDVLGPEGKIVADGKNSEFIGPESEITVSREFVIGNPLLWSPESPGLYSVNIYLLEKNKQVDHFHTLHGIRSAVFDPDKGFVLNGRKVMMKGVCIHHDGGELGAAVPAGSWERRFKILKKLGVNAIRFAHNPPAPEVLDLCDRLGFLVIDEMYDKWEEPWQGDPETIRFEETWQQDLTNFIRRDRNHPSVVLWSLGNEVVEQLNDPVKGREWYRRLSDLAKGIDPSREVTVALHPGYKERGNEIPSSMMHLSPVVSYNYRTDSFNVWHQKYPDLVFIASETKPYGTRQKENYQVIDYSDNSWNDMEEFVAGQFIWAGIDYLGESAGWPDRGFMNGLLETNGFIKPSAWYIASVYREDPMVKLTVKDSLMADSMNRKTGWQKPWFGPPLVDHWNFDQDPTPKEVVVFTNCERVDLHLNNRLVGSLKRDGFRDGVIKEYVGYEHGTLIAEAFYTDAKGVERKVTDTLVTSEVPYRLAMNTDRDHVTPGQRDVVHIATRVVDSAGTLRPDSRKMVSYTLDGPGRIRAIDNGDLSGPGSPRSASKEVRRGKQLLILQAGDEPGDLIIKASAEGLHSSSVKITSKK